MFTDMYYFRVYKFTFTIDKIIASRNYTYYGHIAKIRE